LVLMFSWPVQPATLLMTQHKPLATYASWLVGRKAKRGNLHAVANRSFQLDNPNWWRWAADARSFRQCVWPGLGPGRHTTKNMGLAGRYYRKSHAFIGVFRQHLWWRRYR